MPRESATRIGDLEIHPVAEGDDGILVNVRADRPGERAVSTTVPARDLIELIAAAARLNVTITPAPDAPPEEPVGGNTGAV